MAAILVIINVVVYLGQELGSTYENSYLHYLALQPDLLAQGYVWQMFTFQFLHGGWFHLSINCFMLWFIGRHVEELIGRSAFLKLYFISGMVGGLTQACVSWMFPDQFPGYNPVVGASAGVCGLVAAFATIHWEQRLIAWVLFILPVPMRGKYVVLLLIGLCAAGMLDTDSNIAHAAHLGGVWMGVVYIRWIVQSDRLWGAWETIRSRMKLRPLIERVDPPEELDPEIPESPVFELEDDLPPDEFIEREVDPILDKISESGIQSLTDRERRILEKARELMAGK